MVNAIDDEGNTPTHYAKDLPTLRTLLEFGADLTIHNNDGETPTMFAEKERKNTIFQYLKRLEKDPEATGPAIKRSRCRAQTKHQLMRHELTHFSEVAHPKKVRPEQGHSESLLESNNVTTFPTYSSILRSQPSTIPQTVDPYFRKSTYVNQSIPEVESPLALINKLPVNTENEYKRKFIYREWNAELANPNKGYIRLDKFLAGDNSEPEEEEDRETFFYCFWLDSERIIRQSFVQPYKYFPHRIQIVRKTGDLPFEERSQSSQLTEGIPRLRIKDIQGLITATRDPKGSSAKRTSDKDY